MKSQTDEVPDLLSVDIGLTLSTEQSAGRPSVLDHETRGSAAATGVDSVLGKARGRESVLRFRGRRDQTHGPDPARILPGAQSHVRPRYNVHVTLFAAARTGRLSHQYAGRREKEEEPDVHRSRDGSAEIRVLVQAKHSSKPRGTYKSIVHVVIAPICLSFDVTLTCHEKFLWIITARS